MRNKLDDLHFYVMRWDSNHRHLQKIDIFGEFRERVANLIIERSKENPNKFAINEPLMYVFGSCWGRCEWEMLVTGFPGSYTDEMDKISVYDMFLRENSKILLDLIADISLSDAHRWLRANKTR